ncbi:hypothetical protein [Ktedonobacter robiniae]|uniref:DUF4386 domain-containing protein n=1 Tax=Ktedonobacter robiniae TaxID=2778365 RepID=A0ABQ3V6K7_9CHLR|nr:hypothetical protein [Ktedonobacter robiniae]GHO60583.1 hypothetical protein KSB_90580 [Ktedonobacter robiniae]
MNVKSTIDVSSEAIDRRERHSGPHLGAVATVYVVLFLAGLSFVTAFATNPSFPSPNASATSIVTYFQTYPEQVRISAFLSIGSLLVLGVFAASMASRFRFLGARSAWVDIMLFAGLITAFDQNLSHLCEWALTWPGITQSSPTTLVIYYLLYGSGGPGFAVPMGLFVGSISLIGARMKLLPAWIVWSGFVIALLGELSWLNLLFPTLGRLPLTIPLTRFPSFAWVIVVGFILPKTRAVSRT